MLQQYKPWYTSIYDAGNKKTFAVLYAVAVNFLFQHKSVLLQGCTNPRSQVVRVKDFLSWFLIFLGPRYGK